MMEVLIAYLFFYYMKKIKPNWLTSGLTLLLIATGIVAALSTPLLANQPLVLAYQDSDNFPYQIGNGDLIDLQNPGVAVEQMLAVGEKLGLEIQLQRTPWKRGLILLKQGHIDGLFNASFKKQRQQYGRYPTRNGALDFSRRSYSNSYSLFKSKQGQIQWDGKRFNDTRFTVFVPLGFSIADNLRRNGLTVSETSQVFLHLTLVSLNRIDAVALLTPSGEAYLRNHPEQLENVTKIEPPLVSKDYYLMLSHQLVEANPTLAEQIWNTVGEIRDSPAFAAWHLKYQAE